MENLTKDMLRFKEASRHVWNAYLIETQESVSLKLQESFEAIERELLRALVLLPSGIPDVADSYRRSPMPILLRAKTGLTEVSVQFGAVDANSNIRWELPCLIPASDISRYRFIEFFEWNPYGYIDLSYVKALTANGRLVLVEQMYCDFLREVQS